MLRKRYERKQLPGTIRRDIKAPSDPDDPENYPSLIKYLEAKGQLKHGVYAVMLKARNMFLAAKSVEDIARQLGIDVQMIDRWALLFSWEEERDRRMFEKFRSINGAMQMFGEDLNKKHERIAASIEGVAERMLQRTSDGRDTLSPRDLTALASVLKSTQEVRKAARGEGTKKSTTVVDVNLNMPASMEKLANAMVDAFEQPKLVQAKTRTIAVGTESAIAQDVDFERTNDRKEKE